MNNKQKTILLVEDESLIAMAETRILEKYGYKVISVSTGEEAIKAVRNQAAIDLILMDINLGSGIDGTESAMLILEKHNLPLIFLSSHTEPEVVEKIEGITSYGYIVKNSGATALIASIKMAFRLFETRMKEREKEDALQEVSKFNEKILSESPVGSSIYDALSGKCVAANKAIAELIGADLEQVLAQNFYHIESWKKSKLLETAKSALSDNLNKKIEVTVTSTFGKRISFAYSFAPFLVSGKKYLLFNLTDTTSYIERNTKVQDSENKFKSITDNAVDSIFIKGKTRRYTFVNRAMTKVIGLPEKEFFKKSLEEIYGPEQAKIIKEIDDRTFSGETINETRQLTIGQKKFFFNTSQTPLSVENGEVTSILGVVRDVTEQMESKDQLAAAVVKNEKLLTELQHRAKNSFAMISSLIELMKSSSTLKDTDQALTNIEFRVNAISEMYDLLYETASVTEVQLDAYIVKIISSLSIFLKKVTLNKKCEVIIIPVKIAIPIGICISELITNTVKYAFPNNRDGVIMLSIKKFNTKVIIEISDNGIGLPERFDRSKTNSLGLKIVDALVKQINGSLKIENKNGTWCELSFPMKESESPVNS